MKQTFSKKPWIPEFFPRGTIVEFDTSVDSEFGAGGTGEVDSVVLSDIDNLVLILKNIVLSKGKNLGHDSYSSGHVTRIIKRGSGPVVYHEQYRNPFQDRTFSQRGKVWQYGVATFFRMLMINTSLPSMMAYKSDTMGEAFLKQHPGEYYPKKQLRKWFKQNRNRFLKSMRERTIAKMHYDLGMEIDLSDDLEMLDSPPSQRTISKKSQIQHCVEDIFLLQPKVLHWNVLTYEQVKRRVRYGHQVLLVTVEINDHKFSFYSDNPSVDRMMIELVAAVLGYGLEELKMSVTASAVTEFLETEEVEDKPTQSLYGLVYELNYLLCYHVDKASGDNDNSYNDDGLWHSDIDF